MKRNSLITFLSAIIFFLFAVSCKKNPVSSTAPVISFISPVSGVAGIQVIITGKNFSTTPADNTVKFNGVATTVTSATATSLVVDAPAGGTTGKVSVSTINGSANGPTFTYNAAPPPPTITSISPVSGAANTVVTINGTNFKTTPTDNTVKFNGSAATVQTATSTVLTVLAPSAGTTGAVTVTTIDGTATGPVFSYSSGPDVYLVGKGNNGWGYWKNSVFTAMPSDCLGLRSVYVSGTDVYVCGTTANGPTYWKNGVSVSLPMSTGNSQGWGYSIFVSGTDVYVGGYDFNSGGGNTQPRLWKNGVAVNVPLSPGNISAGAPASTAIILSVFVSGSDVYLAGYQYPSTTNGHYVATYWMNGTPITLSDGTKDGITSSIFVSGTDVYVAGNDGLTGLYWKNGAPVALNVPVNTIQATAEGVYVDGTDVYVSGYYRQTAKYWKNGTMVDLTTTATIPNPGEYASGITGIGSDIYISGSYTSQGGGYWANGLFTTVPTIDGNYVNGIFVQ